MKNIALLISGKTTRYIFLLLLNFGVCSCGLSNFQARLNSIKPYTTKNELEQIMDQQSASRGFVVYDDGVVEEVVELTESNIVDEVATYSFVFIDGKLVHWGPGGIKHSLSRYSINPDNLGSSTLSAKNTSAGSGY